MRKTTFKPKVTTVLQITAGQTLEAVIVDDKVFIEYPMPEGVTLGGTGTTYKTEAKTETETPVSAPVEKTIAAAREKKVADDVAKKVAEPTTKVVTYTEDELMDVEEFPIKRLLKICAEKGITVPAEGKNTNKKLRLLILEAQENVEEVADEEEEEEDETPAPKSSKKSAPVVDEDEDEEEDADDERATLIDMFTRYDEVEIDDKKLLKELVTFGYEKADAQGIIDDFNEDTEVEIEAFVDSLLSDDEEDEDEEEEETPPPAKKGATKKAEPVAPAKGKKVALKEVATEIADLEVGDKVKVYFESEEEFYTGVVASIDKKGNVTVDYDDNTTDVLDEEENTEIFVLS